MLNAIRASIGTAKSHLVAKSPSGQIWPNGEFGLGFCDDWEECTHAEEHGYYEVPCQASGKELPQEWPETLTLSNVPNSRKHGLGGITGYGRRMVRNGCFLLEARLGTADCAMWTFTVPTLDREARVTLARNWGKLTNRLLEYLQRQLAKAGRPPAIIGCTEIQTGRLEKYRQGYLHLHLVCPLHSNTGGRFALDVEEVRAWFHSALERHSDTELPTLPRVQVEQVRKSAEGYLGKYLSKGGADEIRAFSDDLGDESVPGQWWFCSALVRTRVKEGTRKGRNAGAVLDAVIQHAFEANNLEIFQYIRHVDLVTESGVFTAGWYGRLKPEVAADLIAFLTP